MKPESQSSVSLRMKPKTNQGTYLPTKEAGLSNNSDLLWLCSRRETAKTSEEFNASLIKQKIRRRYVVSAQDCLPDVVRVHWGEVSEQTEYSMPTQLFRVRRREDGA